MTTPTNTTESSRDELRSYIKHQVSGKYYRAYARNAKICYYLWHILMLISLISGFASSIIAALVKSGNVSGGWQIVLIIVPTLGSVAVVLLTQLRLFEQFRIWEGGRQEFDRIVAEGWRRLASATTNEECTRIHDELITRVFEIDRLYTQQLTSQLGRRDSRPGKKQIDEAVDVAGKGNNTP